MKIVWQDNDMRKYVSIVFCLFLFFVVWSSFYNSFNTPQYSRKLIFAIIITLFIFYLLNINIRTRLTYVNDKGIRVGNAPDDKYQRIIKKNNLFFKWQKIKAIRLQQKPITRPFFSVMKFYITLVTKKCEEYESYISKPEEFKSILKKMGKNYLIKRKSPKYPKHSLLPYFKNND